MVSTNYHALATFHADWFALQYPFAGMSSDVLPIGAITQNFGFFCHN